MLSVWFDENELPTDHVQAVMLAKVDENYLTDAWERARELAAMQDMEPTINHCLQAIADTKKCIDEVEKGRK